MRVLVPYDGSELSEQAAVMAIELLAQHPLDLLLLRVGPDPNHAFEAGVSLENAAARLAGSTARVTPLLVVGTPEQEIVRCADRYGAGLIAMSTHGRPELVRMLLGSVTDRVIRTSPVPVLVIHPPTMSLDRVSPPAGRKLRVLVPLDGSTIAEEAARMAVSLLRPEIIEVSLLTVVGTPQREITLAREILDSTASGLSARGVSVSTTVVEGEAANQIAALAAEDGFDLIVMSTHGHGMLTRTLVGSVTDRVVRTSEVPVLVIQPRSMEVPHDPVSGEDVDPEKAIYSSQYHGRVFAFTSFSHKQQFDGAPEAYIGRPLAGSTSTTTMYDGLAHQPATVPPMARDV